MTTLKSNWTPWTIGIMITGSLILFIPHILECSGDIVTCSAEGAGATLGPMGIAALFAWLAAKSKGTVQMFSKNTFHNLFAFVFILVVFVSAYGRYSDNTDFVVWLEQNATEEDRSFANELQQKLYSSSINDEEASKYINLLLNFYEYRGITREEFKQNQEDTLKLVDQMYGGFADYRITIAKSMLKSWDNRRFEFTSTTGKSFSAAVPISNENLLPLVHEIEMSNPMLEGSVELDIKMIELAARRKDSFLVLESNKEEMEYLYGLAAVPPKKDPNDNKIYRFHREIIVKRLTELEQFRSNIDSINQALADWLKG
jgi:hypothetical protein